MFSLAQEQEEDGKVFMASFVSTFAMTVSSSKFHKDVTNGVLVIFVVMQQNIWISMIFYNVFGELFLSLPTARA